MEGENWIGGGNKKDLLLVCTSKHRIIGVESKLSSKLKGRRAQSSKQVELKVES